MSMHVELRDPRVLIPPALSVPETGPPVDRRFIDRTIAAVTESLVVYARVDYDAAS
jgi:hypothetical protein